MVVMKVFDSDRGNRGQHIDREQRYEQTGLTPVQREELIVRLHRAGWSQTKISKHPQVRMTQQAISLALKRLARGRDPRG
ncbi:hypothetical protein [Mycobacterium sp.]|uniref:hypothetical protein n=1 Tax=Mycobacterium sp. TaxID=1785 RepID=UPI003C761E56